MLACFAGGCCVVCVVVEACVGVGGWRMQKKLWRTECRRSCGELKKKWVCNGFPGPVVTAGL